jgi:hypothetical protein
VPGRSAANRGTASPRRLAADTLEVLRYGQPRRDRWAQTRRAAIHAAEEAFGWTCQTPDVAEPVLTTHRPRTVRLIHPLRHDPAVPTGGTFDQMLADIYNFDRRPGRVYLAT